MTMSHASSGAAHGDSRSPAAAVSRRGVVSAVIETRRYSEGVAGTMPFRRLVRERRQPEPRAACGPGAPPLRVEHALRDGDLLLARREMRGRGERGPTVREPCLREELQAADEPVARVGVPVAARFALGERVPDAFGIARRLCRLRVERARDLRVVLVHRYG